ncbi:hypothetical protein C817_00883 [Dorea sp. 5-2]|jgi:hypothetical protein|nr:hypothetical protein C817_00883 [Dorea sp. 5-2]MCI9024144.1 hypothetical protein [Dorea sp.]MDE6828821.1 hypothetical protein [Lachnospiraceae bacterium]
MREVIGSVFDYKCDREQKGFGQVVGFLFRPEPEREEKTEFELSGLIAEELEVMSRNEWSVLMKRAGLNPDQYDF